MSDHAFKDDVSLDRYDLDNEAERQSSLYLHWSQKVAKARRDRDRAKLDYESRRAELGVTIRASAEKKLTNDQVTDQLDAHLELRQLRKDWIEADYEYNELEGACTALEQKKSMIELLTKLQLNNYFSRPDGYSKKQAVGESFRTGLGASRKSSE